MKLLKEYPACTCLELLLHVLQRSSLIPHDIVQYIPFISGAESLHSPLLPTILPSPALHFTTLLLVLIQMGLDYKPDQCKLLLISSKKGC